MTEEESIKIKARIIEIDDKLQTADDIKRNQACSEALSLIQALDNDDLKDEIRKMIVFHLIDASREQEAKQCIDELMQSNDYFYKLNGHHAYIFYCRRFENDKLENAILLTKQLAKSNNHKADYAVACLELAKYQYKTNLFDDCINTLMDVILISDELHNVRFLMAAKYYTALALNKKGQKQMALEYLRDVSDLAYDTRGQHAAMFSEIKRASILNDVGRTEETINILNQWCDNFEIEL